MRYLILLLCTAVVLFLPQKLLAQDASIHCGMTDEAIEESKHSTPQFGGKFISATGTLRVLVIFVRFADDHQTSDNWPDPNTLPPWAENFVDNQFSSTGSYSPGLASDYFYQNSYGNFHVIGDVYYLTTDHNEMYYRQLAAGPPFQPEVARAALQMEVFDKLDAAPYNVDFSLYDNWNRVDEYDIQPGPDDDVDMIWFLTRDIQESGNAAGQANFHWAHALLDTDTHVRDGVALVGGFPGSGIGMFRRHLDWAVNPSLAPYGKGVIVNHVAHEMTHYFFGSGHFAIWDDHITTNVRSNSSLKTYAGGWYSLYSGYEKWRLNWLEATTIWADGDNYELWDLATTTDHSKPRLYRINIPDTPQYFLIENRRWLSEFEPHFAVSGGGIQGLLKPGLLVYQIIREFADVPSARVQKLDADGRYVWNMLHHSPNGSSQTEDFIDKGTPDSFTGYSETERIYIDGYRGFWLAMWNPNSTNPFGGGPYISTYSQGGQLSAGDDSGDSLDVFDVGDVITPWSNPGSHRWHNNTFLETNIGIEVKAFNSANETYTIAVRLNDPEDLSPSRPMGLSISKPCSTCQVTLTWEANTEPDVVNGGQYEIYRGETEDSDNPGSYQLLATIDAHNKNAAQLSWTDDESGPNMEPLWLHYYVVAIDNSGKTSAASEGVAVHSRQLTTSVEDKNTAPIRQYGLSQNYPNPFNPITTIRFTMPVAGLAKLIVYNILGQKIATLVNDLRGAGHHEVSWDGRNDYGQPVASGVYLYQLEVDEGEITRKMMLAR